MSIPKKTSIQAVTDHIKLKNLRAAADELKQLEPHRKQYHNFDRLVASVHSPLNNAEKLLFEAHALIPGLVNSGADQDPATATNRTRAAIAKLVKARNIVKDDGEINALLKRCLAALEVAETKVSAAQSHVVRGHWDAAYQNIQEAAQFDDSPDVEETRKYITRVYKVHLKDNAQFQAFIKIAKITGAVLGVAIVGVLIYSLVLRFDAEQPGKARKRPTGVASTPTTPRADAATDSSSPAVTDTPTAAPPKNVTATNVAAAKLSEEELAEQNRVRRAAEEGERLKAQNPVEKVLTINASDEMGTNLGALPPGTKITLRYASGTWCAWLRPTGFSPDQPSEGGNRNRLAIVGVKGATFTVLKLVGYKTQDLPFSYTVSEDYDRFLLRINNEPGNFSSGDGSVVYDALITPPTAAH